MFEAMSGPEEDTMDALEAILARRSFKEVYRPPVLPENRYREERVHRNG
ncbi:hypothetical protein L21_0378 [Methanoculleus chikugoensis]|jgi:hypothetical protein|uniref:Uncharacterized protein n=1 Tax=Methanoculleus chikugoensis TaxID=118126 RepID=A0A1M4MHU9_9EURY|nr:hypothetical protein [Methanoculleus chikugoensis]SCL74499.1 hypothetical protein L21_0378 [Methanoculleus chikugoensis]